MAIRLKHASRPDKWDTRGVRLDVDAFPPYVAGLDSVVESIFVGPDEAVLRINNSLLFRASGQRQGSRIQLRNHTFTSLSAVKRRR